MGLILIKVSLQDKSYSSLKKRFPTMCETLEALRNPPLHLLEEEKVIKKVFLNFLFTHVRKFYYNFLFFSLLFINSSYSWTYRKTLSDITTRNKRYYLDEN